MLARVQSKTGESLLTYNGKYLASSVSAAKEADTWVQRCLNQLQGVTSVFVLGVGCGYHLSVLQKSKPNLNIVAIDCNSDCIAFTRAEQSLSVSDIKFVHADSIDALKSNPLIITALCSFYTMVSFTPAQSVNLPLYESFELFLGGRSLEGLSFVSAQKLEFAKFRLNGLASGQENKLISIKDFTDEKILHEKIETKMIFKALRELVN